MLKNRFKTKRTNETQRSKGWLESDPTVAQKLGEGLSGGSSLDGRRSKGLVVLELGRRADVFIQGVRRFLLGAERAVGRVEMGFVVG